MEKSLLDEAQRAIEEQEEERRYELQQMKRKME